jgi:hypothetical protein
MIKQNLDKNSDGYLINKNYLFIKETFQFNLLDKSENIDTLFFDTNVQDRELTNIPENIKTIIFNDNSKYNSPLNSLPNEIKKIKFGKFFTMPLDNLPDSLEEIEFADESEYNIPLNNLPSSLKKITFGKNYNSSIDNLPYGLEFLNIKSIRFNTKINKFPQKLKKLFFSERDYYFEHEITNLPEELEEIRYPYDYQFEINSLPKSIKIVRVSSIYKYVDKLKSNYPDIKIFVY